jgi:hypothetical protein
VLIWDESSSSILGCVVNDFANLLRIEICSRAASSSRKHGTGGGGGARRSARRGVRKGRRGGHGVSSCECASKQCFDETRPPGQQFKCPTQPGSPLAKLLEIRVRTGRRPPLILKHIRWGVYHDKPFEPETIRPLPRHLTAHSLVIPSPHPGDDEVTFYPPRGSPHEHTFVKPILYHLVSALNDGAYLVYEDCHRRQHEPPGITCKYLKRLLGRTLHP